MAGGKETPRQKMIGMMYLVLTALLALNVSKQVIAAFITLNDKLDASAEVIEHKIDANYSGFDKKRATIKMKEGSTAIVDFWEGKAFELKDESDIAIDFLLRECNEMILEAEGENWIEKEEEIDTKDGKKKVVRSLKSLFEIEAYDNYDIPTHMFVGGDPYNPNPRGLAIPEKIHEFRDKVCNIMGTYTYDGDSWTFEAPKKAEGLGEALKKCNPEDTAKIRQVYETLTYPETLYSHGEEQEMPWPSVMFDHAPIVAAAAMFTSLKLDIKNAESIVSEYLLAKIDVQMFDFNAIAPLAYARTSYLNQGDSMNLNVMIAAYDTTEVATIKYGIDADTANPDNWKSTTGAISLYAQSPGAHKVKGVIGVREKGQITWKDFDYTYSVGQPMGVVSLPEMNILYWGYDNVVKGTASGFDPEKVQLNAVSGCKLTRTSGGKYIAKVDNGTRKAIIGVSGNKEDGTRVNLGTFEYVCKPFPQAQVYVQGTKSGETVSYTAVRNMSKVTVAIDPASPITTANYTIQGGEVFVSGLPSKGNILPGGALDGTAKSLVAQSQNKTLVIEIRYMGPDRIGRIATYTGKVK